jgi:hypothetical protein
MRALPFLLFATACAHPAQDRSAWLIERITTADQPFWQRPELLADKYARMAADPYDFLRGSLPLAWADLARPGDRLPTAFLTDPASTGVWLVGDPHPENFGTLLADGQLPAPDQLEIEAVDLDATGFGPWILDLWRLSLGIALLADTFLPAFRDPAIAAVADGYLDGLGVTEGRPWDDEGRILRTLRTEVTIAGAEGERLAEWTRDGQFQFDRALTDGEGLLPLDPIEAQSLDTLWAQLDLPPGARLLDRARRYGAGVASLPAIRFLVLWDAGDPGPGDDGLLQLREVVEPPRIPGGPTARFDDVAVRVVDAARAQWRNPAADPRLGAARDGARAYKVASAGSFFDGLEHDAIQEQLADGVWGPDDLADLGYDLGFLLAAAHSRAPTVDGGNAVAAILGETSGRRAELRDELLTHVLADLAQLRDDHALFAMLVAEDPLLGVGAVHAETTP